MKYPEQAQEIALLSRNTGLSIEEMAELTGIHPKTISNAASGAQKLSEGKLMHLRNLSPCHHVDVAHAVAALLIPLRRRVLSALSELKACDQQLERIASGQMKLPLAETKTKKGSK